MTTQQGQLSFDLDNPGADDTIYISADPSANKLNLKITTTVDTTLIPGEVVPYAQAGQAGVTASLFYLDLSPLKLTQQEFQQLTLDGSDWNFQLFYSASNQVIGFAPKAQQSLTTSVPLSISVNKFTLATQPPSVTPTLFVYYFRAYPDQVPEPTKRHFSVAVLPPPNTNDLDLHPVIAVTLDPTEVVNCPVGGPPLYNDLTLIFSPGPNFIQVPAGQATTFTLSFVYADDADGFGAMMTAAQALPPFSVTAGPETTDWGIQRHTEAEFPYWTLQPPPNQPIVKGANDSKSFLIQSLVTNFQPGPTVVSVAYQGVPGYRDGVYSIPVLKRPHVKIESFKAIPEQSVLQTGEKEVTVTLSWEVNDATQLTLQPGPIDVTGLTSKVVSISETTQYTLIAEGQRPGNVDNTAYASCTAHVVPVVDFEAHPAAVCQSDFPYPVELSWNVSTSDGVTLTSSVTGQDSTLYPSDGSVVKTLSVPQMFTLTPQHAGVTASRGVIVSAFAPTGNVVSNGLTGAGVAAPTNAPFIAMVVPAANQVAILSTATFQPMKTISVGSHPQGLAFSPDGSSLYVANSGDGSVCVIRVTNTNGPEGYSFGLVNTVQVGGAPQQVAVSADGAAWVSIDAGSGAGKLAKITNGLVTPKVDTVAVGTAPRGVAVTPSGGLIFVANSGSGSVSVIANGVKGPLLRAPVSGLNQPVDVAVSPDGASLLVACAGDLTVVKVDIKYYQTAPKKPLSLDETPAHLGMFYGGDYVLVGCSSTAILLNYKTGTTERISLAGAAQGVGVTPEDGMALVSVAGQDGVSVITFNRYAQADGSTDPGGAATDVAVTPDGSRVLVWCNALITLSTGPDPIDGVAAFEVNGDDLEPAQGLSDCDVAHLAISPGAQDDAFYLAPARKPSISLYRTSTMVPIKTISLPAKAGVDQRSAERLALSADGSKLFALTKDAVGGGHASSIVVFAADLTGGSFTPVGDVTVFQRQAGAVLPFLAAAPDGSRAYTIDPIAGRVYAIEQAGQSYGPGSKPVALPATTQVSALAVLPDGLAAYVFATVGKKNIVCVISLPDFTSETIYLPDDEDSLALTAVACSPDSKLLLGTDTVAAGVRVYDAASLRIVQTLSWPTGTIGPTGIAISPDGSRIFSASTGVQAGSVAVADQIQPQP